MTITLRDADGRAEIAVNQVEKSAAEQFLPVLKALEPARSRSTVDAPSQREASIPGELIDLFRRVLDAVASGERITVGTLPVEMTTAVAADQLGISRPTLMKLIASGEIPAHKVGTHNRIKTDDVMAFRKRRAERQRAAFDELRALDEQLSFD